MEFSRYTDATSDVIKNLKDEIGDYRDKNGRVKEFSDVIDDEGHQYVDIVLESGGVLGIALIGFTHVLEEVGIRFLRIGGSSAGAIIALLIAGMGAPGDVKSIRILEEIADLDLYKFLDGDKVSKRFVDALLTRGLKSFADVHGNTHNFIQRIERNQGKAIVVFQALRVLTNIRKKLGLNPGHVFQAWLEETLKKKGVTSTRELLDRLEDLPETIRHRDPQQQLDVKPGIALVAADVTTQTKAIFPKMAELYWKNPDEVNPSNYVRASMSIPIFFEPFRVNDIPKDEAAMNCWRAYGYAETLPDSCLFVDGGIMSNFPIYIFHRPDRVPSAPTFGVKLGRDQKKPENITQPSKLLKGIFDSARFNLDSAFITRNPDYRKLVSNIDTGDYHWLDFKISDEGKVDLFRRGAIEAAKFLRKFDWKRYKKIREGIVTAIKYAELPENSVRDAVSPVLLQE